MRRSRLATGPISFSLPRQNHPASRPAIDFPKINKEMVKDNFFEYLDFALQFAPASPEEQEVRAKLAKIGIGPNKTSTSKTSPWNTRPKSAWA